MKGKDENLLYEHQHIRVTRLDKDLEISLESLDKERVSLLLRNYILHTSVHLSADMDIKEKYYYLMSLYVAFIQNRGWYVHDVLFHHELYSRDGKDLPSHLELLKIFEEISRKVLQHIEKEGQPQNKLVQQVMTLVEERIYEDISLKEVAENVYVNSSYLSRLFSKEKGMSFSQYVVERKMLVAKTMLQKGEKISTVSKHLAYKDVSYFTKVFRRYWGMTPRGMLTMLKSDKLRVGARS